MKKKTKTNDLAAIVEERKYLLWTNDEFFLREAYKTFRTNVSFSLAGTEGCRMVAVTSGLQSEGKSTVAVNLAMSFADMGNRVLIIDCDLRRPKLGRLLNIHTEVGLTDVLLDGSRLASALVRYRADKNLVVMTSGSIPPNPSELLGSERMQQLLNLLKGKYDYIILDTPPVNMVTDAMVLAPRVDGMLFVVRAGQSDKREFAHAMDQLEYAHAKVLGVAFNGSNQLSGGYGYKRYGYGYRRGYGYGYGYQQSSQERQTAASNR